MSATGRFITVPLELATTPRNGETLCDRWWAATAEGLLFYILTPKAVAWSPQCNVDRAAVDHLIPRLYPHAEPLFVPVAYSGGHWNEDYGNTGRFGLTRDEYAAARVAVWSVAADGAPT